MYGVLQLQGPISVGSSFSITSMLGGKPAVLAITGSSYYWAADIDAPAAVGIFSASGVTGSITVTDTVNQGGLAVRNQLLVNTLAPGPIPMVQTSAAPWWYPDLLLSSVAYSIAGALIPYGPPPTNATGGAGLLLPATNLYLLPVVSYYDCASGNGQQITDPGKSIANYFCLNIPGANACNGLPTINNGWTTQDECYDGIRYTYCPVGSRCGDSNCNGPCPVQYDDCRPKNGEYGCVFDPNKYFNDTEWWASPYFIGAIVGVVIIIIFLILFLTRSRAAAIKRNRVNQVTGK